MFIRNPSFNRNFIIYTIQTMHPILMFSITLHRYVIHNLKNKMAGLYNKNTKIYNFCELRCIIYSSIFVCGKSFSLYSLECKFTFYVKKNNFILVFLFTLHTTKTSFEIQKYKTNTKMSWNP